MQENPLSGLFRIFLLIHPTAGLEGAKPWDSYYRLHIDDSLLNLKVGLCGL